MKHLYQFSLLLLVLLLPAFSLAHDFEVDGIYYNINGNEVTVTYKGTMSSGTSIFLRDGTIGIADGAFSGCTGMIGIDIPNSVETIGEQAFQGCTGLTSVTIGSGVTVIGTKAFNYCNALENVKCISTVPPAMASSDCFSTAAYNRATLLVPRQQIETYQAADYWYKFTHIDGWGSGGRGDVNEDGNVNISDVTALIALLLNNETTSNSRMVAN